MFRPKHLSKRGAALIGEFEGFRSAWYLDVVGVRTIGFGHTGPLPSGFTAPLSHDEGLRLLQHDAERCAAAVRAIMPPILRQTRFDALVSLAFNLGPGILDRGRTIGDRVRTFRRKGVASAILMYDHAGGQRLPGLTRRRRREAKLWNTGSYEA